MSATVTPIETLPRSARMLRTAMGADIARWLKDPTIIEIMLNPDGRLWIDRLSCATKRVTARSSTADRWCIGSMVMCPRLS